MTAADRAAAQKIDTGESRRSPWRYLTQRINLEDLRQAVAQRNSGSAELRHRAGPAGVPPRCGRRQYDLDTSLDDEWIVRIGHAPRRIRAREIRPRCRTEEFGRRFAHDRTEIMDQVRLIGKAAGICDIGPAKAVFPCGDDLCRICLRLCRT